MNDGNESSEKVGGRLGGRPVRAEALERTQRCPASSPLTYAASSASQKTLLKNATVTVPDGVTVSVVARKATVKGPRGTLVQDLRHLPVDIKMSEDGKTVTVERWFTSGKQAASIRTVCSHLDNMIIGVTKVRSARARGCRPVQPAMRPTV